MSSSEALKESIWLLVASIPSGKVLSYGEVASRVGFPKHARYVGSVLKNLPNNTELPWHRVVNAQGRVSFSIGSAAYRIQVQRLEVEGVKFKAERIDMKVHAWR